MDEIKKVIIKEINKSVEGIHLDKFIDICLFHEKGYYNNIDIIGESGDFTTAPETSQLFGEILGLYIYNFWTKNLNLNFNLVELGPGNGTLFNDILRINKNIENFISLLEIKLIEINDKLKNIQKKNLSKYDQKLKTNSWCNNFKFISNKPSIIVANEFFDCFSIKQYLKLNKFWNEKMVRFNNFENKFFLVNSIIKDKKLIQELDQYVFNINSSNNGIVEISKNRNKYFDNICKFLLKNSGLLIIIDYGYVTLPEHSTLQSIKLHKKTNVLEYPGKQDITSLVNFLDLIKIAEKNNINYYGPIDLSDFLLKHGINERKNKIIENCNDEEKKLIEKGFQILTSNKYLGKNFKVFIVSNFDI